MTDLKPGPKMTKAELFKVVAKMVNNDWKINKELDGMTEEEMGEILDKESFRQGYYGWHSAAVNAIFEEAEEEKKKVGPPRISLLCGRRQWLSGQRGRQLTGYHDIPSKKIGGGTTWD